MTGIRCCTYLRALGSDRYKGSTLSKGCAAAAAEVPRHATEPLSVLSALIEDFILKKTRPFVMEHVYQVFDTPKSVTVKKTAKEIASKKNNEANTEKNWKSTGS